MGNCSPNHLESFSSTYFDVYNVDARLFKHSKGKIQITNNYLILYNKNTQAEPLKWPLNGVRRYGYHKDIFLFESGRKCPTGEGLFAFKCCKAKRLNESLHKAIVNNATSVCNLQQQQQQQQQLQANRTATNSPTIITTDSLMLNNNNTTTTNNNTNTNTTGRTTKRNNTLNNNCDQQNDTTNFSSICTTTTTNSNQIRDLINSSSAFSADSLKIQNGSIRSLNKTKITKANLTYDSTTPATPRMLAEPARSSFSNLDNHQHQQQHQQQHPTPTHRTNKTNPLPKTENDFSPYYVNDIIKLPVSLSFVNAESSNGYNNYVNNEQIDPCILQITKKFNGDNSVASKPTTATAATTTAENNTTNGLKSRNNSSRSRSDQQAHLPPLPLQVATPPLPPPPPASASSNKNSIKSSKSSQRSSTNKSKLTTNGFGGGSGTGGCGTPVSTRIDSPSLNYVTAERLVITKSNDESKRESIKIKTNPTDTEEHGNDLKCQQQISESETNNKNEQIINENKEKQQTPEPINDKKSQIETKNQMNLVPNTTITNQNKNSIHLKKYTAPIEYMIIDPEKTPAIQFSKKQIQQKRMEYLMLSNNTNNGNTNTTPLTSHTSTSTHHHRTHPIHSNNNNNNNAAFVLH